MIASNRLYVGAFEAFRDIAADAYGLDFTFLDFSEALGKIPFSGASSGLQGTRTLGL